MGRGVPRQRQAAASGGPVRRLLPGNHLDQLAEVVATVTDLRQNTTAPYDFVVGLAPGIDPAPYAAVGATWWLVEFPWDAVSVGGVRGVLRDGPAAS